LFSELLVDLEGGGLDGGLGVVLDLGVQERRLEVESGGISVRLPGIQDEDGSLLVQSLGRESDGILGSNEVGVVRPVLSLDFEVASLSGSDVDGFHLSIEVSGDQLEGGLGLLVEVSLKFPDVVLLVVHLGLKLELGSSNSKKSVMVETEGHGRGLKFGVQFEVDLVVVVSDLQGVVDGGLSVLMPLKLSLSLESSGSDLFNVVLVLDLSGRKDDGSLDGDLQRRSRDVVVLESDHDVSVLLVPVVNFEVDLVFGSRLALLNVSRDLEVVLEVDGSDFDGQKVVSGHGLSRSKSGSLGGLEDMDLLGRVVHLSVPHDGDFVLHLLVGLGNDVPGDVHVLGGELRGLDFDEGVNLGLSGGREVLEFSSQLE